MQGNINISSYNIFLMILISLIAVSSMPSRAFAQQDSYSYWVPYVDTKSTGGNRISNQMGITAFDDSTLVEFGGTSIYLNARQGYTIYRPTLVEGMKITSSGPLQIYYTYQIADYGKYEDGYLFYSVPEESILGTEYWVPSGNRIVAVVATEDNTTLTYNGVDYLRDAGSVFRFTSATTGSQILADKPVGVTVVNFTDDHYGSTSAYTLLPINRLGIDYYAPPEKAHSYNLITDFSSVRLVATEDNTTVEFDTATVVLSRGESHIYYCTNGTAIHSDKPVSTVYLSIKWADDPWGPNRYYQYAQPLIPVTVAVKRGYTYGGWDNWIISLADNNTIILFASGIPVDTLLLNEGERYLTTGSRLAVAEKQIQITSSGRTSYNGISEQAFAMTIFGDIETVAPQIVCNAQIQEAVVCQIGEEVCINLQINGATNVSVEGADWSDHSLCFFPLMEGEQLFSIIASNSIGADTCEVTVNVTSNVEVTFGPDNLSFLTWNDAPVGELPTEQTVQINSLCDAGLRDWTLEIGQGADWLTVSKYSGTNVDSVTFGIVDSSYTAGAYPAMAIFRDAITGEHLKTVSISLLVEDGISIGNLYTSPGNTVHVPINLSTLNNLELTGFTLPLEWVTSQPTEVTLDSVVWDTLLVDTVIIYPDSNKLIVSRPSQIPPLPDSTVFQVGYMVFTIGAGAQNEIVTIDTTTIDTGSGLLGYEFYYASGDTLTPSFDAGAIVIGFECEGTNSMEDIDGDGIPAGCDNCPASFNPAQEDNDGNGIGNACCCGIYNIEDLFDPFFEPFAYTGNADCDIDGKRNLADITTLISHVYIGKQPLCCPYSGNVNGDIEGKTNLADITRLIDHVYISKDETEACQ